VNVNIYRTQSMLAAINKMMPIRTFFRDTFFPGIQTFTTEDVLLDFKKGKRKMAPFVAPRVGGVTMDRQGYRTDKYTAPKIAPQRQLTVDDLVIRGMGENLFSPRTPADRQAELLGRDINELDEMITRREEWMIRELLFNGKITMNGYIDTANNKTIDQTLDYEFTNKEILTGTHLWSESTSTKLDDLKRWRKEVIRKSGHAPTMAIFGDDAFEQFLADPDVSEKLKQFNSTLIQINPTVKDDALTYIGRIAELGLDIFTYNDWYLDDDGNEFPFVPADQVLLARPNMGEVLYGAVTQLEQGQFVTIEGSRVPKSWADEDNDVRMIRISSRPVPKPEDIDDWFVAQVL